ncbi:hypothetical protein KY349_06015 [Candidatus Woesearchaeota archaeon]|jgi:hypothetical protein|nr:hypothetical protein [Candidatus Woesearchaeota archaeon]
MKTKKAQNLHSPTLNTILMVEAVLEDNEGKYLAIPELKKQLPKQVNHNTLMQVLAYLEESNKISVSLKGITWMHKLSKKLSRT